MKRILRSLLLLAVMLCGINISTEAVTITKTVGWFESGAVEWTLESGATYTVSYSADNGTTWTQLDQELVRKYSTYGRADMVGLKAGSYMFKVSSSISGDATTSFTATAHDRSGFAHYGRDTGIGAYNNDGTLKSDARVLYVTAANAKTVSLEMMVSSSKTETRTGLQDIVDAYQKSAETRPLAIRIIGTIKAADMDEFGSSAEGLQVKGGGSEKCNAQLTIEGIGNDAAIHGFGILCRSISSVEFRNFAIMICLDDCLSLDTDNKNIWIHNMDFFYGGTGGDADQAKGDGTVDIKGKSSHVTVSYNHFYDSGKCSLGGMKSETNDCWMTYHHNWFDHSDSRHPRIRTAFYHVANNYFDGNSKYGTGVTMGGSAFCEGNFYRNVKYPFLISKQGTDAEGAGTFSGENGGVIKAFNNVINNPKQVLYYDGSQTDGKWDAVKVDTRDATVSATALTGGTSFNNAAAAEAIKAYPTLDDPSTVQATVRGDLGAGRMEHGDFKWTFDNSVQDANYAVISELKTALVNYQSTLVAYGDGTAASNAGATETVDGGDGKGIDQAVNDAVVPSWGAGGDSSEDTDLEEEGYIASADDDMFWFGENEATTTQYVTDGVIAIAASTAGTASKWEKDFYTTTTTKNVTYTSEHVGAFNLAKASESKKYDGGSIVFYCPKGVTTFKFNMLRSGTGVYQISKSTDGTNYTAKLTVTDQKAGVVTKDATSSVRDTESTDPVWIKITNGSTGSLYVFGVQIDQNASSSSLTTSDLTSKTTEKAIAYGGTYTLTKGTDYTTSSTGTISYSSDNPSVATVDADGNITAVAGGNATITISQAKDDTYKAGTATISIAVTDSRAESTLALHSDASVTLSKGDQSTITVTGVNGTVSYASNSAIVATVSDAGVITAVGPGTATITVTDAGNNSYKPGSVTVEVKVLDSKTITLSKSGFATFSAATNMKITGATVYKAYLDTENSVIKLTKASDNIVPAGTGVLLYGTANATATAKETSETSSTDFTSNHNLLATTSATGTLATKVSSLALSDNKFVTYTGTAFVHNKAYFAYTAPVSGEVICDFTESKPSSDMVSVTGSYSTKYGPATYNSTAYNTGVKMESKTSITITPGSACKVTLVFADSETGKKFYLATGSADATKITMASGASQYTFDASANTTYTLTKADGINLFLVVFKSNSSSAKTFSIVFADDEEDTPTGIDSIDTEAVKSVAIYNLAGQKLSAPVKGQINIINGKKVLVK